MMYHYYANKDELFLSCLETIFQALGAYIGQETENLAALPACDAIKAFFLLRESFFQERPREKRMFEDAMLRAPSRLSGGFRSCGGRSGKKMTGFCSRRLRV